MSDARTLRGFLEDDNGLIFTDAQITGLLTLANDNVTPTGSLTLNQLYFAAHLGWIRKAGKIRVKNQKIAIFSKNTKPAFDAALEMAEMYKGLALGEGDVEVQIPELDTTTPMLDSTVNNGLPADAPGAGTGLKELW